MAFTLFARHAQGVQLLQRSLARGRLGHAYLFAGDNLEELESLARTLAKTLNCQKPVKKGGAATDCCDECSSCQEIIQGRGGLKPVGQGTCKPCRGRAPRGRVD